MIIWLLLGLAGSLVCALCYIKKHVNKIREFWLETAKLSGPEPSLILGNLLELAIRPRWTLMREWFSKYGKVYIFFHGLKVRISIGDARIVQQISTSHASIFNDHAFSELDSKYSDSFLLMMRGQAWRKMRTLVSPALSLGQVKRMWPDILVTVNSNLNLLDQQIRKTSHYVIEARRIMECITFEMITSCLFGWRWPALTDSAFDVGARTNRYKFLKAVLSLANVNVARIIFASNLPAKIRELLDFHSIPSHQINRIEKQFSKAITHRRSSEVKSNDFLQMLVDTQIKSSDSKEQVTKLTDHQIIGNMLQFLVAGFDTSASSLSNCLYVLSFHQQIQQRLFDELAFILKNHHQQQQQKPNDLEEWPKLTQEQVNSCHLLHAVVCEVLRMMPPITLLSREAKKDYWLGEPYNFKITKGSVIMINVVSLHYDPDYWQDPETFDPDRFMPENRDTIKPGSFVPFGIGPRHCIGINLALATMKLTLANLILRFCFLPAPDAKFSLSQTRQRVLINTHPMESRIRITIRDNSTILT